MISIIVPAYNEEKAIGRVIEELVTLGGNCEIIVVDDASEDNTYNLACQKVTSDNTKDVMQGFSPALKIIRHPYNKGYGASLKTGIKNASGDIICFFDGDGQHRVEDLREVIKYTDEYDVVLGMRSSESHIPFLRKPGKKILSIFANYLSGIKIPDLNCGLRGFKKDILLNLLHILPDGFSFSTTTTLAAYKIGYNINWVPVTTRKRTGKSTVRQARHGMQTLLLIIRIISLFDPFKVFLPTSIVIFGLGIIYAIFQILTPPGGIGEAPVFLLIAGLLIFFFGILADQIATLRREGRM